MAWFKKAASAVNTHYDVATELQVALSPSIRRVRKLEERGTPANGVITGIHFSLNSGTTRKEFAVSVLDGDGTRRFGVRTQPNEAHRLRLGMPVVAKLDGDRGIALAQFDAVGFDDDPPAGSIAAEVEGARGTNDAPTVMGANLVAPVGDPSAAVTLDGTMRASVDARRVGQMSQNDFDKALDDWCTAGMCTAAQVEAARAAAA